MKKSLALMLALIMVLCMIPTTALAVPPGKQSVTIKLAYSDYGYEPTGSKGFTYTYSNPLYGGSGWIYTLGPVEQYVTPQEMSGYTFTGYSVMEKGKRVSKMPGDTWDLGQGNGGMLHVQLQKNNDTPTSSTLQVNTVITGDQELTSNGTPFPVTVGTGYIPDDYKTGLDTSNYTYTFVKAERKSGTGLFKLTASSSGKTSTDSKLRKFFPASGENVVTVYYTAKSKAAPTPTPPANDDIKELVGSGKIQVQCTTANNTHPIASYSLLDESYTTGAVIKDGNTYTCTITVDPAKYVDEYNKTHGGHALYPNPQSGSITFKWENNSWALAAGQNLPIIFTVIHNTQEPPKPDPRPSATPTIDGLTGVDVVEVKCITENSGHETKRYTLLDGGYTVGDVESDATSGYTCTITVKPGKYESAYNETYSGHTLVDPSQPGKIKLVWDKEAQKWKLANPSGVLVVFDVECKTTQPENPAELTSFVKSRVTAITDNMPKPPEGVTFNTDSPVTFDANHTTANLLYSFTVTGTPGAEVTITDSGAKFYNNNGNWVENSITVKLPTESIADYVTHTVYGYRQFTKNDIDDKVLKNTATAGVEGSEELVPGKATVPAEDKTGPEPSENPNPSPSTEPTPKPTPTPYNGGGGHWHPTTTPVPVIVIPPKTGDMTIWQSILHFLGIR